MNKSDGNFSPPFLDHFLAGAFHEFERSKFDGLSCNSETKIRQCICGHYGSLVFGGNSFEFVPERPQVTKNSKLKSESFRPDNPGEMNIAHLKNWVDAIQAQPCSGQESCRPEWSSSWCLFCGLGDRLAGG